jgi:hypothetical protein
MSLSHQIRGSEPVRLQAVGEGLARACWPWRPLLVLAAVVLSVASYPIISLWVLLIVLCWLFIAGAADLSEHDVRRIGPRGAESARTSTGRRSSFSRRRFRRRAF